MLRELSITEQTAIVGGCELPGLSIAALLDFGCGGTGGGFPFFGKSFPEVTDADGVNALPRGGSGDYQGYAPTSIYSDPAFMDGWEISAGDPYNRVDSKY